jgi:hypothetical protein
MARSLPFTESSRLAQAWTQESNSESAETVKRREELTELSDQSAEPGSLALSKSRYEGLTDHSTTTRRACSEPSYGV